MSDEYWDCQNCGKEIEAMGNDDFHFEVSDRMNVGVPNPGATTVCGECWDKYGYREAYERQQMERRVQELEKENERLDKRMVEAQHQATKAWSKVEEMKEVQQSIFSTIQLSHLDEKEHPYWKSLKQIENLIIDSWEKEGEL